MGGELDEHGSTDIDHYFESDEKLIEFKSDGERTDGILCINMDLVQLPPFLDDWTM